MIATAMLFFAVAVAASKGSPAEVPGGTVLLTAFVDVMGYFFIWMGLS